MNTFTPDSSVASDVIPSPNYGERKNGRQPAMIALCRGIMLRRNVPSHRVLGHSDVAPPRKKDPGEKFPWHSLANSGVGHWVQPAPIVRGETLKLGSINNNVASMQAAFARYG